MKKIDVGDVVQVWFGIQNQGVLEGRLVDHLDAHGVWVIENKDGLHYVKHFATMTRFSEEKIRDHARRKGKEAMDGAGK